MLEVASGRRRDARPLAAEASSSESKLLMSEGPPLEIGEALHLVMERVSLPDATDLEQVTDAIAAEAGLGRAPRGADRDGGDGAWRAQRSQSRRVEATCYRELPFTVSSDGGFVAGRMDLVARTSDDPR